MRNRLLIVTAAALWLAGCGSNTAKKTEEAKAEPAPQVYKVTFATSKGNYVVEVHRDWAPIGADRFYELVKDKYYDDARFFRVLRGFIVQFGLARDPEVSAKWRSMALVDDPPKQTNARGTITYAKAGPNTRTTQVFINLGDNRRLDADGFAPFGLVTEGMDVVDSLYSGYGEGEPQGVGPSQQKIEMRGNEYLRDSFPRLDYIRTARIVE